MSTKVDEISLVTNLHQKINILRDYGFLFAHGIIRESVREGAAEPRVLFTIHGDNRVRVVSDRLNERASLGHLRHFAFSSDTVTIDILPGTRVGKREVPGANTDDRSIFIMKPLCVKGLRASSSTDCPRELRCSVKQRARKVAERVKVEIVDDCRHFVYNYLCHAASYQSLFHKNSTTYNILDQLRVQRTSQRRTSKRPTTLLSSALFMFTMTARHISSLRHMNT